MDDWDHFVDIETNVCLKDVTPIRTIIKKSPTINPDNIKMPEAVRISTSKLWSGACGA